MDHTISSIEKEIRKLRELIDIENDINNKKKMEYEEYLLLCERGKLIRKNKNRNKNNYCYLV